MDIQISAWSKYLGPDVPADLQAWLTEEKLFASTEAKVPVLRMYLGECVNVRIWPADPQKVRALGEKLVKLSEKLKELK